MVSWVESKVDGPKIQKISEIPLVLRVQTGWSLEKKWTDLRNES